VLIENKLPTDLSSQRLYFEMLYDTYNRRHYIHPDPLEIVLEYPHPGDQEIAGFICSLFAIGRVEAIVDTVRTVCRLLGEPRRALLESSESDLERLTVGFVYRFYRQEHLAGLLIALSRILKKHDSLERLYMRNISSHDPTCFTALDGFVSEIYKAAPYVPKMIPVPSRGSSCKRLLLYLRWMVRKDLVDPGPWREVSPASLLVPVDVHMHRLARLFGITKRKSADMKTSREITAFFRQITPLDPVRYDFALTRFGIHPDLNYADLPIVPGVGE
jgi:uncharacterized protein (TIGR02757 family)